MNFLNEILPGNFVFAAGWAIIDSVWQGAVIGILLAVFLLLFNKKSPRIRELLSFGALAIIFTLTVLNFSDQFNFVNEQNLQAKIFLQNENTQNVKIDNASVTQTTSGELSEILTPVKNYFNQNIYLIVAVWLLGVLFFMFKLFGGFIYTQRIKIYKTNPVENKILETVERLAVVLEIDKKIKVLESAIVKVPVVIGYFKPVVLFPIGLLTGLPQNQIEAILLHELAHIKRADYLINIFQSFVEVILFYHPVVWWISSIIRNERENACDDTVLLLNENKLALANALLNVSEFSTGKSGLAMTSVGNKNQLLRRIKRMVNGNKELGFSKRVSAVILLLVTFFGFTAVACSSSEDAIDEMRWEEKHDRFGHSDFSDFSSRGFSFDEDGDDFRVKFRDGKIYKLYKNGDRVPDDEIYKYEDMVYEKKQEVEEALAEVDEELSNVHIDMKKVKRELAKLREFNSDELKRHIDDLRIELKDIHKNVIKDVRRNKRIIVDSKRNIRDHLIDIDDIKIDVDMGDFHESMAELKENLGKMKEELASVDWDEFRFEMNNLKDELKDLDFDMSEMKVELKKLKGFLKEFRTELVKDGYIDENDDDFEVEFNSDELIIDGKRLPDNLLQKYKKMYKEHFGKEIDEGLRFRN